jgi:hypothetical protein
VARVRPAPVPAADADLVEVREVVPAAVAVDSDEVAAEEFRRPLSSLRRPMKMAQ